MRWAVLSVASVALIAGPTTVFAGAAEAAPRPTIVAMGDSFAANYVQILPDCERSAHSWPSQLRARTGTRVVNEGCAGSTLEGGYNVYDQARKAAAKKAFHGSTRAVLVQLGFNDFGGGDELYKRCLTIGCPGSERSFPRLNSATYAARLRPLVDYVRYHAPNARIAIVGYPEMYADGQRDICTRVIGGPLTIPNTSAAPAFMRKLNAVQEGAAKRLGISFVNIRKASAGHGMCAAEPWTNGIFWPNPDIASTFLVGHGTSKGDWVTARTIAQQLKL